MGYPHRPVKQPLNTRTHLQGAITAVQRRPTDDYPKKIPKAKKLRYFTTMNEQSLDPKRYPIGACEYQTEYSKEQIQQYLLDIETFPARLEYVVQHLSEQQLQSPYREGGWTLNQVIHHCADSHLNALLRIKLALSVDNPTISPYPEDLWAEMSDYTLPFNNSITLLFAVHRKLNMLLRSLDQTQLNRTYYHPQYQKTFRVSDVICLYAWHGNHHLAHITQTLA
jgi:hypothetical protein